tara:strand:+ start:5300 stop:5476 length:177 start_codon:yes stop_codon:yes gene_type:complete
MRKVTTSGDVPNDRAILQPDLTHTRLDRRRIVLHGAALTVAWLADTHGARAKYSKMTE